MPSRFDPSAGRSEHVPTLHRGFEIFGEQVPLIGRRARLRQLVKTMEGVRAKGRGGIVALVGPEGIGKTRLLFELAAAVEKRGIQVYRLRADNTDGRTESRLAAQLVRQRLGLPLVLDEAELKRRLRHALEDLVPERRLGDAVLLFGQLLGAPIEVSSDTVNRLLVQRAMASVIGLLRRDGKESPRLVLVDRLDASSAEDLTLLVELARGTHDLPILLALAARSPAAIPEEIEQRKAVIKVKPLDRKASEELAKVLLSRMEDPPVELVLALAEKSRGLPGAMEQILRTLATKGIVDIHSCPWVFRAERLGRQKIPQQMPQSAEGTALARLGSLDARSLAILQKAAIMGPRFWFGGVLALMRVEREEGEAYWVDDRKRHRLNRVLLDLQGVDLIHFAQASSVGEEVEFLFQSPREAEILYTQIREGQRAIYHRLVAQWMRRACARSRDLHAWHLAIARHDRAGGSPTLAARSLYNAALEAHRLLRQDDAIAHLNSAQKALREDDADLRYDVHLLLGDLAQKSGELDLAVSAYENALYDSVVLDDMAKGADAYVRYGQALAGRGAYAEAAEMVRRGRALYHELGDQEGIARALDELGSAIWLRGAPDAYREALTHFLKSLAMRRRIGEPRALASSLSNLARIHLGKGYAKHARDYLHEALDLNESIGDRWGVLATLAVIGATWFAAGDVRRAVETWSRAMALAEEIGDRHHLCILLDNLGEAYLASDDYTSAQVYLSEAQELAREIGEARVVADAMRNQARLMLLRGRHAEAVEGIALALAEAESQDSRFHAATCRATQAHVLAASLQAGAIPETSEIHREISQGFNSALTELERMGDDLQLAHVLRDYAHYLLAQGVDRGATLRERSDRIFARLKQEAPEG